MARVVIVGGHGKIARELGKQLSERGDTPVGLIRKPEQATELERLGSQPVIVDIEAAGEDEFITAFQGADAVVFAAGAGPDGKVERKQTVDLAGSLKSVTAASRAGVSRFVQVSAIGVDRPVAEDASEVWQAYVAAKRDADTNLRDSGLDWTILRPGVLTDDAGTGLVTLGSEVERGEIPRADVAALVVAVLDEPETIGKQWEAVGGHETIAEALAARV